MSDIPGPLKATLDTPEVNAELAKPEVKSAFARLQQIITDFVGQWTQEEWATAAKVAQQVMNGIQNIPREMVGKLSGTIESPFFAAAYGLFIAVWAEFELTIEILIMRQLRLSSQEVSIVCGGLSFGSKIHMLLSLLARDDKNKDGIDLLRQAQNFADRNSFAHGFLYGEGIQEHPPSGSVGFSVNLLKREVKYEYIAKSRLLDIKTMTKHVVEFNKQHKAIKNHFGISSDDVKAYQKSILDDALARQDEAERHQQSLTNARIAKQKRRGLHPQSSQPKSHGPRLSAKQRRKQALKDENK